MSSLEGLSVGDSVVIRWSGRQTVESITDIKGTQVICGDYSFWAKTGKEVKGDMWNSKYASPVKENGDE